MWKTIRNEIKVVLIFCAAFGLTAYEAGKIQQHNHTSLSQGGLLGNLSLSGTLTSATTGYFEQALFVSTNNATGSCFGVGVNNCTGAGSYPFRFRNGTNAHLALETTDNSSSAEYLLIGSNLNAWWGLLTNRADVEGKADNFCVNKASGTKGCKLTIEDEGYSYFSSSLSAAGIIYSTAGFNSPIFATSLTTMTLNVNGSAAMAITSYTIQNQNPCLTGFRRNGPNICLADGTAAITTVISSGPTSLAFNYNTVTVSALSGTKAQFATLNVDCRITQNGSAEASGTLFYAHAVSAANDIYYCYAETDVASNESHDVNTFDVPLSANKSFDYSCRALSAINTHTCTVTLVGYKE